MDAHIRHFDLDMDLDVGAARDLPEDTREFVLVQRGALGGKCALVNGWGWNRIAKTVDTRGTACITLCDVGRPSHDCMYVWVFSPARAQYELYFAPYGGEPSIGPLVVAHTLSELLEYCTTHGFQDVSTLLEKMNTVSC